MDKIEKSVKRFTNFSDEDFVGVWNKVEYITKAGESKPLPGHLAEHFAKHLIDREINKRIAKGETTKSGHELVTSNSDERKEYMAKCVGVIEMEAEDDTEQEVKVLEKQFKKRGRKKQVKKEEKKDEKEEEFAELKEK